MSVEIIDSLIVLENESDKQNPRPKQGEKTTETKEFYRPSEAESPGYSPEFNTNLIGTRELLNNIIKYGSIADGEYKESLLDDVIDGYSLSKCSFKHGICPIILLRDDHSYSVTFTKNKKFKKSDLIKPNLIMMSIIKEMNNNGFKSTEQIGATYYPRDVRKVAKDENRFNNKFHFKELVPYKMPFYGKPKTIRYLRINRFWGMIPLSVKNPNDSHVGVILLHKSEEIKIFLGFVQIPDPEPVEVLYYQNCFQFALGVSGQVYKSCNLIYLNGDVEHAEIIRNATWILDFMAGPCEVKENSKDMIQKSFKFAISLKASMNIDISYDSIGLTSENDIEIQKQIMKKSEYTMSIENKLGAKENEYLFYRSNFTIKVVRGDVKVDFSIPKWEKMTFDDLNNIQYLGIEECSSKFQPKDRIILSLKDISFILNMINFSINDHDKKFIIKT